MKTSIINGSEVSRLSVAIHSFLSGFIVWNAVAAQAKVTYERERSYRSTFIINGQTALSEFCNQSCDVYRRFLIQAGSILLGASHYVLSGLREDKKKPP